jgi:glycosyltransferase involved in cell wall biosynthesis
LRIGLIIYGDLETMTGGFLYDRMFVKYLREQGDTVEVISVPWRQYGRSLIFNVSFSFLSRLKNLSPDLVLEDELIHPSFFMLNNRIRRTLQCPIIAVVHHLRCEEDHPRWANRFYRIIESRFFSSVDGLVCNSRNTAQTVIGLTGNRKPLVVAYPAGDRFTSTLTEKDLALRAKRSGPLELLFLGTLIPRKSLHTLVSALSTIDTKLWHLTVAGSSVWDHGYTKAIHRKIHKAQLDDQISFLGEVPDPDLERLFEQSHLLVVPSSFEGFGIVYLEGMGFGLPAIASQAGGAAEVVTHGVNGYLVAPGDVGTLGSHIREIAENRGRLLEMSMAAHRAFLKHPSWAHTGKVIYDFLHTFKV